MARVRAEVAAGQVGATIRALSNANLVRQAAGLTTDQTAEQSYAEAAAAFALLESGLAAYGGEPGRSAGAASRKGPGAQ